MNPRILTIRVLVFLVIAVSAFLYIRSLRHISPQVAVKAATNSWSASQSFQATDGGMAQYGTRLQQSTSYSATMQALTDWNSYIESRCEWSMSSSLLTRIGSADWNDRQSGSPRITAEQLADASARLINSKLATMTAAQQTELGRRIRGEVTPKGALGINQYAPYVSAAQQADGRWVFDVSPLAFTSRKAVFSQLAPGMMSSGDRFYPGEAMMVLYSLASGDMGFGLDYQATVKKALGDLTGLDMTNRSLYGENGYFFRRPFNSFATEQAMSELLSELGAFEAQLSPISTLAPE